MAWRLVLFCWSVIGAIYGQTSAPVLSLDEAVELAMKENRQVQLRVLDVENASEETRQAKTDRYPVLKVHGEGGGALRDIYITVPKGIFGIYPATGPIPATTSHVQTPQRFSGFIYGTAAQPLSQLYRVGLAVQSARLAEQLARAKLRQQQQDVAQQAKQQYFQLAVTQSQLESAAIAEKYLEELVANTGRALAQETVLKADRMSAEAKLKQQRYQTLVLQDQLDSQKESFNLLLGRDLRTALTVTTQPVSSADDMDLQAAQERALRQRPEMEQARLESRRAEISVRGQRSQYIPDVSVQISYYSFPSVNFLPENLISAGFAIDWQPFDWGLKKHKIAELRNQTAQAGLSEKNVQQQVLLDVDSSYRKLKESRSLLDAQQALQEAEREKLREVMNAYEQQAVLLKDVLGEQESLASADTQFQQALSTYWTAKAAFDHAVGNR